MFFVCLEFQIIRFVISTFTPRFFIEISFVLLPVASRSAAVEYEEDDDGLDDIERGLLELIVEPDRAA